MQINSNAPKTFSESKSKFYGEPAVFWLGIFMNDVTRGGNGVSTEGVGSKKCPD